MWPFRRHGAYPVRSAHPYWLMRNGSGDASPPLDHSLDCDIAIVGAGISGALIADALVPLGKRIVMLDRNEPGQASTAASTALLQYEIDTHLTDLVSALGAEQATRAYRACVDSFELLERRYPELLASCDYRRSHSLYLAADEADVGRLRAEFDARRAIGIQAQWLDADGLRRDFGLHRPAAIRSTPAATFDPLRFTRAVLAGCRRHGVACYSRSTVLGIEEVSSGLRLKMAGGHDIQAKHVVVAAGYESLEFLSEGVADIDNTFALVTEPLPASRRRDWPLIWESARPYIYLRTTPDGRLMIGGADVPFKTPAARQALLPRQVQRLAAAYQGLFDEDLPPVAHAWAGSFASTRHGLPHIGRAPGMNPRLLFALCFGGNGITYAAHAGGMIRAALAGESHELEQLFGFLVD